MIRALFWIFGMSYSVIDGLVCSIYGTDMLLSSLSVKAERRDQRDKSDHDRHDRKKSYFEKPAEVFTVPSVSCYVN